jgi:hypothetical protein
LAEAQSNPFVADLGTFVKSWIDAPPSVDAVRPAHCEQCGSASRPVGRSLVVVGHGVRERQLRGPPLPGAVATDLVIWIRRYLCLHCKSTMTVGPPVMAPRRQYSRAAIAWALALLGVVGLRPSEIRRRVSSWHHRVETYGWRTLHRWVAAATLIFPHLVIAIGDPADTARRLGELLCGPAPPDDAEARAHRAFVGGWQRG